MIDLKNKNRFRYGGKMNTSYKSDRIYGYKPVIHVNLPRGLLHTLKLHRVPSIAHQPEWKHTYLFVYLSSRYVSCQPNRTNESENYRTSPFLYQTHNNFSILAYPIQFYCLLLFPFFSSVYFKFKQIIIKT